MPPACWIAETGVEKDSSGYRPGFSTSPMIETFTGLGLVSVR